MDYALGWTVPSWLSGQTLLIWQPTSSSLARRQLTNKSDSQLTVNCTYVSSRGQLITWRMTALPCFPCNLQFVWFLTAPIGTDNSYMNAGKLPDRTYAKIHSLPLPRPVFP